MLPTLSIENSVYAQLKASDQTIFVHRCQKISRKELKKDLESYRTNLPEGETKSCILDLEDIKALINHYSDPRNLKGSNPINGFRIYFVRGGKYALTLKGGRKRQLNIILVPTHQGKKFRCEDIFDGQDDTAKCWVLSPGGETTGLCPTNCGGSQ